MGFYGMAGFSPGPFQQGVRIRFRPEFIGSPVEKVVRKTLFPA